MDLDLRLFAPSLRLDRDGIWVSGHNASVSYPAHGNADYFQVEDRSFWFQHRNSIVAAVLRLWPPLGNILFDVGGGNGYVARALQDEGWNIALVEPGPEGAANARRARGVSQVVCARLQDAGFNPASLPAVGLFDVVEHIEQDQDFLVAVRDLLRPGGRLFATVPAYNLLWSAEDEDAGHFRRYTTTSIEKILRATGFEVDFSSYFFSMLPLPIFLLRTLPSKLGLRRRMTVKQTLGEHGGAGGRSRLMKALLTRELRKVSAGRRICFGGSIVVVARRKGAE